MNGRKAREAVKIGKRVGRTWITTVVSCLNGDLGDGLVAGRGCGGKREQGMGSDWWASGGEKGKGTAGEGREGGVGVSDWRRVSVRRGLGAHKGMEPQ